MSVVDVTDFSDEEGEVPPLLGPSSAATPTVASKPAAVPKKPGVASSAAGPSGPAGGVGRRCCKVDLLLHVGAIAAACWR